MCATCFQFAFNLMTDGNLTTPTIKFAGEIVSTKLIAFYCLSDSFALLINLIFLIFWIVYLTICRRLEPSKGAPLAGEVEDVENNAIPSNLSESDADLSGKPPSKTTDGAKMVVNRSSTLDAIVGTVCLISLTGHFCLLGEQFFLHRKLENMLSLYLEPLSYAFSMVTMLFLYLAVFDKFNRYLVEKENNNQSSHKAFFNLVFLSYWLLETGLCGHKLLLMTVIGADLTVHLRAQIYALLLFFYALTTLAVIASIYLTNHKGGNKSIGPESTFWSKIRYLHPYTSLLSKATYSWFFPLLKLGYKRPIEIEDLGTLPKDQWAEHQYERFYEAFHKEKAKSDSKARPVSLWKCYWATFKYSLMIGALLRILADVFALVGPLSIRYILDYVKDVQNQTRDQIDEVDSIQSFHFVESGQFFRNGFVLAFVVLLATCLQSTFSNTFNHYAILEGIHLRSALQCLVYKKSLRMTVSLGMDAGSLVNHMSQDAFNMMMMFSMGHYIWALPLKIIVLLVLLYFQLGISSLIGAAAVYILAPIQYYLASKLSRIQKEALKLSDTRLRKTSELLMGIKLLKLLGWELIFADNVKTLRDQELRILKKDSIYVAVITFITQATSVIVTLVTFVLYPYIEGKPLSASTVFSGLALFNQLTVPLYIIPFVIPIIVNAFVSTKRLSKFFSQPEIDCSLPWRSNSWLSLSEPPRRDQRHQQLRRFTRTASQLVEVEPKYDVLEKESVNERNSAKDESQITQVTGVVLPELVEVQVKSGYFTWNIYDDDPCLRDINLKLASGKLTVVTGPIGSGKTSLISALLGEMVTLNGEVRWSKENTNVAYLPQNPWLLNVTFRENILFGSPLDTKRYKEVIEACALQADMDILPAKDRTEIGERGVNLSGGQRQRIALARALYSKARTVILDSPLSALDSQVANHVFEQGIKEYLVNRNRTVIMVTHKVEYIKQGSHIIVMERGRVKHQGSYSEILNNDPSFSSSLEKIKNMEQNLGKNLVLMEECKTSKERQRLRRILSKQTLYRTLSTSESVPRARPVAFFRQVSHDPSSPLPCQECGDYADQLPSTPDLADSTHPPNYLRMRSNDSSLSRASSATSSAYRRSIRRLISRTSEGTIVEEKEDHLSGKLDKEEDDHHHQRGFEENYEENGEFDPFVSDDLIGSGKLIVEEDRETGTVSKKIYMSYIKACSPLLAGLVIALIAITQAVKVGTDFWLANWTESNQETEKYPNYRPHRHQERNISETGEPLDRDSGPDLVYYITGYVLLSVTTILISLLTNLLAQITSIRAVRLLHREMLDAVVRLPIRFFDSTPIGRILNRFSTDISTIDKKLPTTLPLLLRFLLLCFAAIIVDLIVSPVFIFVAAPIIIVYYLLQHFFRFTSRELQRLDNITKSPIFSHFNQTVTGLSTIRAFKEEKSFTNCIYSYINANNLAFLMASCSNCWLGIALDYLGGLILFSATLFTMIGAVYGDISPSFVGMSITYTLLVPVYLNWVVRNLASLEMHLSAVERIASYSKLEPEESTSCVPDEQKLGIPEDWPSQGLIRFKNVTLSYDLNQKPVLKSISFTVRPGEKVGICGRTGSGKSSLIMALFKMININDGNVYIDNVNINVVGSHSLRKRLSLVPQDTVLFSGTIRQNLDPGNEHSDDQIWEILEVCELKCAFKSLEDEMSEDGSNLSAGQRQLLCLARALLKNKSILVMDEATSSLDVETEHLINKIISKRKQTVISIVHHIPTALSYDKVIVLQGGTIHEIGSPRELMSKNNGLFSDLLRCQPEESQQ